MAAKDFDAMEDSNRSSNPSIHDISEPSRRTFLRGSAAAGRQLRDSREGRDWASRGAAAACMFCLGKL